MNLASWILGLSLIVVTIAIHTTGVVMMASASKGGFGSGSRSRNKHGVNDLDVYSFYAEHPRVPWPYRGRHGAEGLRRVGVRLPLGQEGAIRRAVPRSTRTGTPM